MSLRKLKIEELNVQELKNVEGGIVPVAVAAWWAGATLLAKVGVIAGGVAVVGTAGAVGYYNGYYDTIK